MTLRDDPLIYIFASETICQIFVNNGCIYAAKEQLDSRYPTHFPTTIIREFSHVLCSGDNTGVYGRGGLEGLGRRGRREGRVFRSPSLLTPTQKKVEFPPL